jgi:enoyl-CoA hydratase/carnithine racemase
MSDHVRVTTEAGVTTIRLDRPAKKNALDGGMYAQMAAALTAAAGDPAVRVVVLTGGPETFTSGNDVGEFIKVREQHGGGLAAGAFLHALTAFDKPLVAAVNGWAIGIGTTMLLHADFVYASAGARFKVPFVDLGLCPEAGSSLLLPLAIGPRRAAEMFLLGDELDAATARDTGLITAIVDDPLAHAAQVAATLAARAPAALRATKALMRRANHAQLATIMEAEGAAFLAALAGGEAVEAVTAKMMKRTPDFSRFR